MTWCEMYKGEQPCDDNNWLLSHDEFDYLHGKCHLLAIALHDITGLPMGAYLETRFHDHHDISRGYVALVHAFVIDGYDAIDIRGRIPFGDVLKDSFHIFTKEWFVLPTEQDLFKLGCGRRRVSKKRERYREAYRMAESVLEKLQPPLRLHCFPITESACC